MYVVSQSPSSARTVLRNARPDRVVGVGAPQPCGIDLVGHITIGQMAGQLDGTVGLCCPSRAGLRASSAESGSSPW